MLNVDECENLLKATIDEMEKLLTSRTVIGDPVTLDGMTAIPLLSVSVGFAAGAGSGKDEATGTGGGAGGGFKMKPVAVIVMEKDQVRVEPIRKSKDGKYSLIEGVLEKVPQLVKNEMEEREKVKKEKRLKEGAKKGTEIKVE